MKHGGARLGAAWRGKARHGKARQGKDKYFILLLSSPFARGKLGRAWQGRAGHGMARHGTAWHGMARQGKARIYTFEPPRIELSLFQLMGLAHATSLLRLKKRENQQSLPAQACNLL